MPSTALMIAIGSPLTNALGMAGSVGSHPAVPLRVAGRRGGRVAVPVGRGIGGGGAAGAAAGAACGAALPAGADHCSRAWSSLACAADRSAVSWSSSVFWLPKVCCACVSAVTAESWLVCASTTAWSAFCLASRAADSRLTCSVRARCRLVMTCWLLTDSV